MEQILNLLSSLNLPEELLNLVVAVIAYCAYLIGRRRK